MARYLAWRVDSLDGAYLTEEDLGLVRLTVSDFAPEWPLTITLDLGDQGAIPHCPVDGLSQLLVMFGQHSLDPATLTLYRHLDVPHPFCQDDLDALAKLLVRQWTRRLLPWASRYGYW